MKAELRIEAETRNYTAMYEQLIMTTVSVARQREKTLALCMEKPHDSCFLAHFLSHNGGSSQLYIVNTANFDFGVG